MTCRIPLLFLVALLLCAYPAAAGLNAWTSHGPEGASVHSLVIDPTTPTTLYASVEQGGVFKSMDGGVTWAAASVGLEPRPYESVNLAIDSLTPSTLYAAIGRADVIHQQAGGALFKSTDGAATWSATGTGVDSMWSVIIDPTSPTTLYGLGRTGCFLFPNGFPCNEGLLKSTDGGASWTATGQPAVPGPVYLDHLTVLAMDPTTPTTLYVAAGGVLFKSTDGAASWGSGVLVDAAINALAIDPTAPAVLYAGTWDGIQKSTVFRRVSMAE